MTEEIKDTVTVDEVENDAFTKHAKSVIEAILFAAGYPVKYEKIAQVLQISPREAKSIVKDYMKEYNGTDNGLPRGILLLMFDDACQLCTKEEYGLHVREALGIRRGGNLSPSSIEVLAIIAYNEPVTRAYIDTVRGVDSSYAVTSLSDKHLIEVCGRLDVPGRPLLYRTTDDFLRVFGMQSLSDLPEVSIATDEGKQQVLPIDEGDALAETAETEELPAQEIPDNN
ncbi:MAG: SMC-Scp complex subunit ScpB [Ruminococcaceae bacterium]|nr:SMC-Scp complex subunit ScpB [Oscillospiraceae bacterium]